MYLKLAWRNIWRNKRRTLITTASVFTAVILALLMRSLQQGAYQRMIDNVVSFYTGHIQLHATGYWDDQTIENSLEPDVDLYKRVAATEGVTRHVARLESFALASTGELTKGVMVIGIDPQGENELTHLATKLIKGTYLGNADNAILLSDGLAKYLKLNLNDTLVLLGQGYHGVNAAAMYPVKGIVKFPSPELNQRLVYMPLPLAQRLYSAEGRITSVVISVEQGADATKVAESLRSSFKDAPYEILDWKEMLPDLVQLIEVDNAGGIITISTLYMIIGFGIFGTILMMLTERTREFGILIAIGMKRAQLIIIVTLEILLTSGLGVLLGSGIGVPIVAYFHYNPIHITGDMAVAYEKFGMEPVFPFSMDWSIFVSQAAVVLAITIVLAFYPWFRLRKMKTIEALKS